MMFTALFRWLGNLLGEIWEFIKPLLREGIRDELKTLLPIALEAVTRLAPLATMSGGEKRLAAFRQIKKEIGAMALGASITIGTSLINTAIELALQKLKSEDPNA